MRKNKSIWLRCLRILLLLGLFGVMMAGSRLLVDWLSMRFPEHAKLIDMYGFFPLMCLGFALVTKPLLLACGVQVAKPGRSGDRSTEER